MAIQHEPVQFTGTFEVYETRGEFVDLDSWDFNKIFRSVFRNGWLSGLEVGEVYLIDLRLVSGLWRVVWASEPYEMVECEDLGEDEDGTCDFEDA